MDNVFQAVDGCDLALTSLVGAACNHDFVVFPDGDGTDLLNEVMSASLGPIVLFLQPLHMLMCCFLSPVPMLLDIPSFLVLLIFCFLLP